jgi:DNA-binding transcriptional MocR family regulator
VAWLVAPEALLSKLELLKQTSDLLTPSLDQHIVYEAYRRGILMERLPVLRKFYQDKRTVMQQTLQQELGGEISWPEPKGGFFLWASLPTRCSTDEMLPRAIEQRVIYVAGSAFFVDGSGANLMRLSFSLPSKEKIVEGVKRLAKVVKEELVGAGSAVKA